MAFPASRSAYDVPVHELFPEQYEASKRTIALDFLLLGGIIVGAVVLGAWMNLISTP